MSGYYDLARIRSVVASAPDTELPVREDGSEAHTLTPAAVLFPIVLREKAPTVLLTQRTAHLKDHPGQISFPGGRVEESDANAVATALRETEEEIGLARRCVEIVGFLPEYRTGTGFSVTPVVGFVSPPFEVLTDSFEVESVFEVPLAFLLDAANHKRHSMQYRGRLRTFYAMPYGDRFIWGATAGMIRSLYERIADIR
jgi:8-oxo-dGTP pyrophosphatase MutT (NUDIX family)